MSIECKVLFNLYIYRFICVCVSIMLVKTDVYRHVLLCTYDLRIHIEHTIAAYFVICGSV